MLLLCGVVSCCCELLFVCGVCLVRVDTCGRCASTNGDVLNVHTEAFWMDTREKREGVFASSAYKTCMAHAELSHAPSVQQRERNNLTHFTFEKVEDGTFPMPSSPQENFGGTSS